MSTDQQAASAAAPAERPRLIRAGLRRRVLPLVVYVVLIAWTLGQILPLLYLFINSLKTNDQIYRYPMALPDWPHFENFYRMLFESGLHESMAPYLVHSAIVTSLSLTLTMAVATLAGYALARFEFVGRSALHRIVVLSLAVPIHAVLIPVFDLMGVLGLRNNFGGIALLYAAFWMPLSIVVLAAYFKSFPSEVIDAGRVDGCSEHGVFFRLAAPMSVGAISSLAIVNFIGIWSELLFAFILLNKTDVKTVTVGLLSYSTQYSTDLSLQFAALAAVAAPTIVFYIFFGRQISRGMTMGAFR